MNNIDLRIKEIVKDILDLEIPAEEINNETNLLELGLNSLSIIRMMVLFEEEFSLEFDDDLSIDKMVSVGNIIEYISMKLNEKNRKRKTYIWNI